MQYAASRPFHGDLNKAFDLAIAALTSLGFRLDQRQADSIQLSGPGMNSNRQSPLVGASKLDITFLHGQLDLAADLGAAQRLMRFAKTFPIALSFGLGLVFLVVFASIFAGRAPAMLWIGPTVGVTLLNGAIWAILGPRIAHSIHQRTCRGLESLLSSIATAGEAAGTRSV